MVDNKPELETTTGTYIGDYSTFTFHNEVRWKEIGLKFMVIQGNVEQAMKKMNEILATKSNVCQGQSDSSLPHFQLAENTYIIIWDKDFQQPHKNISWKPVHPLHIKQIPSSQNFKIRPLTPQLITAIDELSKQSKGLDRYWQIFKSVKPVKA